MSKKTLAVELSKFKVFDDANQKLEQYSTDSEIAAAILWEADLNNWIKGKSIIDLGAGTGILGIGCILLGAKKVTFVEIDPSSINILSENIKLMKEKFDINDVEIVIKKEDIRNIVSSELGNADLVVQNPPFGTKDKNADSIFLDKAMKLSDRVITMHKTVTKKFIDEFAASRGFKEFKYYKFNYPLKMSLPHHKKRIEYINVSCWFFSNN